MNRLYLIILIGLISCTGKIDSKEIISEPEKEIDEQEKLELARQQHLDTLYTVTRLQSLKNIVKKEENQKEELIRLIRTTFAFGSNEIILIELKRNETVVNLLTYKLTFNQNCNTPFLGFEGGEDFTTDCYEIVDSHKESIELKNWNKIKNLISDTDFINISYIERGKSICDGRNYLLQYAYPFHWRTEIITLEKSCPGEKSAVYLIGEELIKLTRLD